MRRRRDDEGTVLLLTVGLVVVLLLLVAVVVDVSAVLLSRRALASVADGAAVAAPQQAHPAAQTRSEGARDVRLPLDPAAVDDVVARYAVDARADQPGLRLQASVEGEGVAVVDARRRVRLPFSGWLGLRQVDLHVVARAQSPTTP